MARRATGRVTRTGPDGGYEMTLTRTFTAPVEDVWASLTESDRTAGWFGPWRGDPQSGSVQVQMGFEEGAPWSDVRIDACQPPRRLLVALIDDTGEWNLEVMLSAGEHGGTLLELIQHLKDPTVAENSGPGWEYYLDMLIASRDGLPLPEFSDYYPFQVEYFASQARSAKRS